VAQAVREVLIRERARGPRVGALALLALCACSRAPAPPARQAPSVPPHILLVTIDTLRADRCSGYGYPQPTTPRLDALARQGVRVADAYAPMATTGPSHASMFTGLHPRAHGVVKNGYLLAPERRTLAEALRAAGYATAAVVSSFAVDAKFGLAQGFEVYDDDFPAEGASVKQRRWEGLAVAGGFDRRADAVGARAISWLARERPRGRRFFLWVHYFDPHAPYDPPEPHKSRFRAAYDGEVAFADAELGRLLDALDDAGLRESTLVVVTGDHGEGLGDHGHQEHGLNIYEEAVKVPLAFRWPGRLPAGSIVPGPVSLVDLEPTLLQLALGAPAGGAGRSLAPLLAQRAAPDPERPIFMERRFYDPDSQKALRIKGEKLAVRRGAFKYLEAPEEGTQELYDLSADPGELENLAAQEAARVRELRSLLDGFRRGTRPGAAQRVSPEDQERLRALGYVQ
jgi:arylsulfatase A-like enzyme